MINIPAILDIGDVEYIIATPGARIKDFAEPITWFCLSCLGLQVRFDCALHAGPLVLLSGLAESVRGVGADDFVLDVCVIDLGARIGGDVSVCFEGPTPVFVGVGEFEFQGMLEGFIGEADEAPLIPTHDGGFFGGVLESRWEWKVPRCMQVYGLCQSSVTRG